jgi:hypothetical protein
MSTTIEDNIIWNNDGFDTESSMDIVANNYDFVVTGILEHYNNPNQLSGSSGFRNVDDFIN